MQPDLFDAPDQPTSEYDEWMRMLEEWTDEPDEA